MLFDFFSDLVWTICESSEFFLQIPNQILVAFFNFIGCSIFYPVFDSDFWKDFPVQVIELAILFVEPLFIWVVVKIIYCKGHGVSNLAKAFLRIKANK